MSRQISRPTEKSGSGPMCLDLKSLIVVILLGVTLASCSNSDYEVNRAPNYDHLIGKKFSESINVSGRIATRTVVNDRVDEFELHRPDGCFMVFGVRKADDVIEYWRVGSGAGTCLERRRAINA